jgi:hypothetical protein
MSLGFREHTVQRALKHLAQEEEEEEELNTLRPGLLGGGEAGGGGEGGGGEGGGGHWEEEVFNDTVYRSLRQDSHRINLEH